MRVRRLVVTLVAGTVVGGGGAAVVAAQPGDPCEQLRALDDGRFESFEEEQRAQAAALAACYRDEHERNVRGTS